MVKHIAKSGISTDLQKNRSNVPSIAGTENSVYSNNAVCHDPKDDERTPLKNELIVQPMQVDVLQNFLCAIGRM